MTGACLIDNIDIADLGVLILRGGDNDFISFPSRKDPESNDWPELDGIEIGTDDPVFNEKKVTVKYYLKGDENTFKPNLSSFFDLHTAQGYRTIYIREFDKSFQLRYVEVSDFDQKRGFSLTGEKSAYIDIDYVMDDPVQFLDPLVVVPTAWRINPAHVTINGMDLSLFGIVVQDIYNTALVQGVKEGLLIKSDYRSGLIADIAAAHKKRMQPITIDCKMIADNREDFITSYTALFNKIKSGVVTLGLTAAQEQFSCYYSGMSGFEKRPWGSGRAIASFKLEFIANVFTA
jgi:hypothetical protein